MACVVKRKNKSGADRWVVDFYDQHGRRRWRVFRDEGEAHRWYSELKPQLTANTYRGPEALPTFAAVAEEWLTVRQDRAPGTVTFWRTQIDRHLIPAFGTKRIDQITMQMVNAWKMQAWNREDRTKPGLSRTTVNQVLQTLRGIFKHAVTAEYIRRTPAGEVEGIRKQRQKGRHGQAIDKQKVLHRGAGGRGDCGGAARTLPNLRDDRVSDRLSEWGAARTQVGEPRPRRRAAPRGRVAVPAAGGARGERAGALRELDADRRGAEVGLLTPDHGDPGGAGADAERVEDEPPPALQAGRGVRVLQQHWEAAAPQLSDQGAATGVGTDRAAEDQLARVPAHFREHPDCAGQAADAGGRPDGPQGRADDH